VAVKLGYKNVFRDPLGYPEWQRMGLPVESRPAGLAGDEPRSEAPGPLHGWSMIWTLAGIFFGGIALNLTPCVYPMIPITVSFFGGRAASGGNRKGRLVAHGLCYLFGLALTNSVLGVAAALTGSLMGAVLQNPVVLVMVATVLVVFAASLFGLGIRGRLAHRRRGAGRGAAPGLARPECGTLPRLWLAQDRRRSRRHRPGHVSGDILGAQRVGGRLDALFRRAPGRGPEPEKTDRHGFLCDLVHPCRELEEITFHDAAVVKLAENAFVMVKVDVTGSDNPTHDRLLREYGIKGVPTVVFLDPEGNERRELRLVDSLSADQMLDRMTQLLKSGG